MHYDIIVVGARPGGATAVHLLVRRALKVVLIEQKQTASIQAVQRVPVVQDRSDLSNHSRRARVVIT